MENINKIPNEPLVVLGEQRYRVTITNEKTGEVLYSHPSFGGVFCSVEAMKVLKESGEVDGTQQHLFWGNPMATVHAYLMLEKQVEQQIKTNPFWGEEILNAFKK